MALFRQYTYTVYIYDFPVYVCRAKIKSTTDQTVCNVFFVSPHLTKYFIKKHDFVFKETTIPLSGLFGFSTYSVYKCIQNCLICLQNNFHFLIVCVLCGPDIESLTDRESIKLINVFFVSLKPQFWRHSWRALGLFWC